MYFYLSNILKFFYCHRRWTNLNAQQY